MNTQNLAKYNQEKNEGIQEFINRIFVLWNEEKKKTMWKNYYFTNRMFFIQLFIAGIRDNEIRNRMSIWFKNRDPQKQDSIYSKDVVKIAKEFHKCQQKIPGFMEFLTTLEITDYEPTKKTIIGFINEYPEEVEPFLDWFWTQKIPEFMEYLTRVGITDDTVWPHAYIAKIPKFGFREFFGKFGLCHDERSPILRILEPRRRFSSFLLSPVLAFLAVFGHFY